MPLLVNIINLASTGARLVFLVVINVIILPIPLFSLNVTIVESQSIEPTSIMDLKWKQVAESKGHTATIFDQSVLDNNSFYSFTDILIISSGEIDLPQNRVNIILNFINSGKPVYLQTEHDSIFSTNSAFSFIVRSLGGEFRWKNQYSGNLQHVKVLNSFQDTEDLVQELSYYWYSVSGEGDCRLYPFLEYHDEMHGFQYLPVNSSLGTIITTTDEDWVRAGVSTRLMANIIYHLINPPQPTLNESPIDLGPDTFICLLDTIVLRIHPESAFGFWQDGSIGNSFAATVPGLYWTTIENACENRYGEITLQGLSEHGLPNHMIDTTFCAGAEIFVDISVDNGNYHWMDGSTEAARWLSDQGKYLIEVGNGCYIDTLELILIQEDCTCEYVVPNVFSPNGDGINDRLFPVSHCLPLNFSFSIFDRWGNQVFNTKEPLQGWSGIFKGSELPSGVYVYKLSYAFSHEKRQEKIGDITLLR